MQPEHKTTGEDDPRATLRPLGRNSLTSAYAHPGGQVVLDIWPDDAEHARRYVMSPGQAMVLIRGLADATQRALKDVVA